MDKIDIAILKIKKIVDEYLPKEKVILGAHVKYTLRISKTMNRWLEQKAFQKKLSKADFLRKMIDEAITKDKEYQSHLKKPKKEK